METLDNVRTMNKYNLTNTDLKASKIRKGNRGGLVKTIAVAGAGLTLLGALTLGTIKGCKEFADYNLAQAGEQIKEEDFYQAITNHQLSPLRINQGDTYLGLAATLQSQSEFSQYNRVDLADALRNINNNAKLITGKTILYPSF